LENNICSIYVCTNYNMMRDLREELFTIKGGDFPKWYGNLTKLEQIEYHHILKQLGKNVKSNK